MNNKIQEQVYSFIPSRPALVNKSTIQMHPVSGVKYYEVILKLCGICAVNGNLNQGVNAKTNKAKPP